MQSGRALSNWLPVVSTDTIANKLNAESRQCAGPSVLLTLFFPSLVSLLLTSGTGEHLSLCVFFLARALNSGANGVVYMKCRGRTGDQEGAEPRRWPERAAHIGWRRGFARRIITSLTSLGLVVGMNNIVTAEFSLHVVLQRGGSRLCR